MKELLIKTSEVADRLGLHISEIDNTKTRISISIADNTYERIVEVEFYKEDRTVDLTFYDYKATGDLLRGVADLVDFLRENYHE